MPLIKYLFQPDNKKNIRYLQDFFSVTVTLTNWWIYYLDFFYYLKKNPIIFNLRNGIKLLGIPRHWDGLVINEVWGLRNDYVQKPISLSQNSIVVDIGAHKGYFTVFASVKAPKGKVFAFEPFPRNYQMMKKNLEINNCKNVTVYKMGVAGIKGKKTLYLGTDDTKSGYSILKNEFNNYGACTAVDISTIRLQDIFTVSHIQHIDFLKLDCEGAEYEIFLHTPKNVFKKIKQISMEYHCINNLNEKLLKDIFKKNGFNVIISPMRKEFGMLYAYK